MEVAAGGSMGSELSKPETESSELVGIVAAMIILTFAFGTIVAMGMPIITAVVGLVVGLSAIGLMGHLVGVPDIAPTLATMIGLGVGIDYSLFLVNRHRRQIAAGMEMRESIATTVATSGGAVVFAGGTVVIALLALAVAGIPLVTSLGYASAVAVLTAVLAAITLLPAILALAGRRIDSLAPARVPAAQAEAARHGALGQLGPRGHPPPADRDRGVDRRARHPRDPGPLAGARPGGHRRDAHGHHRAPGLRPPRRGLRRGLQRPPADRGQPGHARHDRPGGAEAAGSGGGAPGPARAGAEGGQGAAGRAGAAGRCPEGRAGAAAAGAGPPRVAGGRPPAPGRGAARAAGRPCRPSSPA